MEGVDCWDRSLVIFWVAADGVVEDERGKGGEMWVEEARQVWKTDLIGLEDLEDREAVSGGEKSGN